MSGYIPPVGTAIHCRHLAREREARMVACATSFRQRESERILSRQSSSPKRTCRLKKMWLHLKAQAVEVMRQPRIERGAHRDVAVVRFCDLGSAMATKICHAGKSGGQTEPKLGQQTEENVLDLRQSDSQYLGPQSQADPTVQQQQQ